MYDVLRADRCISVHGMEARVPFGDLDFVKYVMSVDPEKKINTYGKGKKRGLPATGPMAEKMEIVGNKIILTFENHCGLGLLPKHESLPGFELAGDDNVFYEAEARVIGNTSSVEVSCDKVTKPKNIRYAFRNYCKATLCDIFGFPAFPYRSDRPVPSDLFHTHQPEMPEDNAD